MSYRSPSIHMRHRPPNHVGAGWLDINGVGTSGCTGGASGSTAAGRRYTAAPQRVSLSVSLSLSLSFAPSVDTLRSRSLVAIVGRHAEHSAEVCVPSATRPLDHIFLLVAVGDGNAQTRSLPACLSACLPDCLPVCLSVCLSVWSIADVDSRASADHATLYELLQRWPTEWYDSANIIAAVKEKLQTIGAFGDFAPRSSAGAVMGAEEKQEEQKQIGLADCLALLLTQRGEHLRSLELRLALALALKRRTVKGGSGSPSDSAQKRLESRCASLALAPLPLVSLIQV